jgi:hypothetical protein
MSYTIRPERKEDYREVENHVETAVLMSRSFTYSCYKGVASFRYFALYYSDSHDIIPIDGGLYL